MIHAVVAGIDGSRESRAAGEWAAREAELRGLPLQLVHVWEPVPEPMRASPAGTQDHWTDRVPRETAERLARRHPGLDITRQQVPGRPVDVLVDAAQGADLLVLGSRALSGIAGFLVGSVGHAVVARTEVPVVLVRADEQVTDEYAGDQAGIPTAATATGFRPVVLGLDTDSPDDTLIAFAFEEAARSAAALHVVHGWNLPPYRAYGLPADPELDAELGRRDAAALAAVLRPWRRKYPDVEVAEASRPGSPADHLIDASREASLVVVGRRVRRSPIGAHIGPVTHAVLHHSTAPVAVVAHG
jgi:nucleotide-binding universal stress UspA family protein